MICMMTNADKAGQLNVQTVTDYPGHEITRVSHDYNCSHYRDNSHKNNYTIHSDCHENCRNFAPLYMETTHVGLVLKLGEHNWHDDSDFYTIVWNEEKGQPEKIEYASTRGWSYPNHAEVDATPDVKEKYMNWVNAQQEAARILAAEIEAKTPRIGKKVRTTVTRGKNKNKIGTVVWMGRNQYLSVWESRYADLTQLCYQRVGITPDDGSEKFFIAADKVEVM